jgi:hypothetical protein
MQIPRQYPQFTETPTLILLCSRQHARCYRALDGQLEVFAHIDQEKPHYSDREGLFLTRGHGIVARAGAPLEDIDDQAREAFMLKLRHELAEILKSNTFEQMYLFVPKHLKYFILNNIPQTYQRLIIEIFEGNYLKTKPLKLLGYIEQEQRARAPRYQSSEVKRILEIPNFRIRTI